MTKRQRRFDDRFEPFRARLSVALSIALFTLVAQAQDRSTQDNKQQSPPATITQAPSQNTGTRRIQAIRVSEAIKIDGLLDESSWSIAQPATDFLQQQPTEGAPASERTEVRVLFDDRNIYFGIRAFL